MRQSRTPYANTGQIPAAHGANDKKVFRSTVNAVNAYDGLFRGFFGFDDHRCLGLEPGQNVCGERDDRRGDNHRRENQYPNASVHLITHPR